MDLQIKVKDSSKFYNDIIKEIMPKGTKITVGVKERNHYIAYRGGHKTSHAKGGALYSVTTSQIAAAHEYGLGKMPRRSFIRDTVDKWLYLDAGRLVKKDYAKADTFLRHLANKIYERIQEAFDTNGWDRWAPLSDKYRDSTGRSNKNILTDTGQLRAAVYTEYAGKTFDGGMISGGHAPKREDTGRYRQGSKGWVASLYERAGDSIVKFFHKG